MYTKMVVVMVALLVASRGGAEIVSTGGAAAQIAPPASVEIDALESDTQIRVFDERQVVTLAAPLMVDISAPGVYDDVADLTPATIPAGTVVSSHLIHFDGIFEPPLSDDASGSVTFRDRILGVILVDGDVDDSDFLGAPGTTYPRAGILFRGAELFEDDVVEVGCDTIRVDLQTFQTLDHLRVITAHDDPCGEACSPGFWKACDGRDSKARRRIAQFLAAGYSPTANLNATFGTTFLPNVTLCEATELNGGGVRKLARHAVAALLSAGHPDIDDYPLTPAEVIARVRAGDADTLAHFNDLPCPLK